MFEVKKQKIKKPPKIIHADYNRFTVRLRGGVNTVMRKELGHIFFMILVPLYDSVENSNLFYAMVVAILKRRQKLRDPKT